jgi:hypothetical protein
LDRLDRRMDADENPTGSYLSFPWTGGFSASTSLKRYFHDD